MLWVGCSTHASLYSKFHRKEAAKLFVKFFTVDFYGSSQARLWSHSYDGSMFEILADAAILVISFRRS